MTIQELKLKTRHYEDGAGERDNDNKVTGLCLSLLMVIHNTISA